MSEPQKSYFKNLIALLSGNGIAQLLPFLFAPLIARIYTPQQLGALESIVVTISMLAIIGTGRYELAIVMAPTNRKQNVLIKLCYGVAIGVFLVTFVLTCFTPVFGYFFKSNDYQSHLKFAAPIMFLMVSGTILNQWALRNAYFKQIAFVKVAQTALQNCSYLLFGYLGFGINGLIGGLAIGMLSSNLLTINRNFKFNIQPPVTKEEMLASAATHIDFPLINAAHAFTDILAAQFLLLALISGHFGAIELGFFALVNKYLRAPLGLVSGVVSQLFYKEAGLVAANQKPIRPLMKQSQVLIIAVIIPFCIVLFFFGEQLFTWYLGAAWQKAGKYVVLFLPMLAANFIASVVSPITLILKQQGKAFLFSLIGYSISLSIFYIAALNGFSFSTAFLYYSLSMTGYYVALLIWYHSLAKQQEIAINHQLST
jgi:O-antigen/teichoic acid export membrane protein